MTIESAIFTYLSTDPLVSAVVGTRVYFKKLPQNVSYPAIVFYEISSSPARHHGGRLSFQRSLFQIDCLTNAALPDSAGAAKALAAKVEKALDGYRGTMGDLQDVVSKKVNGFDDPDTELTHRAIGEYQFDYSQP